MSIPNQNSDSSMLDSSINSIDSEHSSKWNIVDMLFFLVPWKKRIILITIAVMLCTAGISLTLDKWYDSKAVILLPEKQSTALEALGGTLGGLSQSILGVGTMGPQRYIAILKSRRLKEAVIDKYDLINFFELNNTIEDSLSLIDLLEETIIAESNTKNGTITVTVCFKDDPEKTAEMANFVVSKLDEINRELSTEQAKSSRLFIEKRYKEAREELRKSEDLLNKFQKEHGIVALPEQTRASIEAAADIQAQISTAQTEYNVLKKTLGENHPSLLTLQSRIQELSKIQQKMEIGGFDLSVLIPFKDTPDLALEYLRLFREVQINQKIVEFLVPQYEQAKIQEARDTPTLLVLDKGKPAAFQYKPHKKILVLLSGIVTFISFSLIVIGIEIIKVRHYMEDKKIRAIFESFKLRNLLR